MDLADESFDLDLTTAARIAFADFGHLEARSVRVRYQGTERDGDAAWSVAVSGELAVAGLLTVGGSIDVSRCGADTSLTFVADPSAPARRRPPARLVRRRHRRAGQGRDVGVDLLGCR